VEPLEVVRLGRDRDRSRALEVAVDAVAAQRRLQGVEVGAAELVEPVDLVGEALGAVGAAVRE
jgi:hypothetical protein